MTADSKPVIKFYDIPCKPGNVRKSWSPSTWQTRIVLNYKRIPYETVWVEYPNIAATCKALGAPPTGTHPDHNEGLYTLPMIADHSRPNKDGSPTIIVNSFDILLYLEKHYPDRPLLVEGIPLYKSFRRVLSNDVWEHIFTLVAHEAAGKFNKPSADYWTDTRTRWYPEVYIASEEDIAQLWEKVKEGMDRFGLYLDNGNADEIGMRGTQHCYSDVTFVAFLLWIQVILPHRWAEIARWKDGRFSRLVGMYEGYLSDD